jgi:hypothetical protein
MDHPSDIVGGEIPRKKKSTKCKCKK